MSSTPSALTGPPRWVKLLISVLVIAQFFVIFTSITAAGNRDFPASPAAQDLATITRPYAQMFFMHNAYRFYAPSPGPTDMIWARFHYQDGTSRWKELPRVEDFYTRIPYQRHIALLLQLGINGASEVPVSSDGKEGPEALSDPGVTLKSKYTPLGRICVESFVRHLANQPDYARAYGNGAPLEDVEMYHVLHTIMPPDAAKMRRRYDDPRSYIITYTGTYLPNGKLREGYSRYLQLMPMAEVFALRVVERDFLDFLDREKVNISDKAALAVALERFGMPKPFRWPILTDDRMLQPQPRDQLILLLEEVLLKAEDEKGRQQVQELQRQRTLLIGPLAPTPPTDMKTPTQPAPR